ncbi:ATP-binding cassette domain-containing protein [Trinickia mobilis]|uniref:ATP-binding cassette domain-containing protein n=1 Tax=Trinickia mobilis TaxID=2816356 RepID=UPI001A90B004|nr:ATP-binding cassette domain-containing protein [Trinickia mobilis]
MTATTLATSFGGIAGTDLEAELAQSRTRDHDRDEASAAERDEALHDARRAEANVAREAAAAARTAVQRLHTDDADARRQPGDAAVDLRGVGKRYGERAVLSDFDLSIERGSFVAIVGRSGCGKSTLLRLVAGLESADAGVLAKSGVAGAPLETRIMFQDSRLLPWKTVLQNVTLGLGRGARDDARSVLAEVGLFERANDWPSQLSGGQRQRVALARALVHRPQLLLLDEPLGALDALTRIEMHTLIERLWREHGFTALLVTHDVQEAVALADRILLIEGGRIALVQPVPLERPRARASAAFSALEDDVLQRVLASTPRAHAAAPDERERERIVRPSDVRWAV